MRNFQAFLGFGCLGLMLLASGCGGGPPEQVLSFPDDRSMGMVRMREAGMARSPLEDLAEAKGEVEVPSGKVAVLIVSQKGGSDLSPLAEFSPDALLGLNLTSFQITDEALEHVTGLTELQELRLKGKALTEKGLEHLKSLTNLRRLLVEDVELTDAMIDVLKEFNTLRLLNLRGSTITDEQLKKLQLTLLNCDVRTD